MNGGSQIRGNLFRINSHQFDGSNVCTLACLILPDIGDIEWLFDVEVAAG